MKLNGLRADGELPESHDYTFCMVVVVVLAGNNFERDACRVSCQAGFSQYAYRDIAVIFRCGICVVHACIMLGRWKAAAPLMAES